ncbi:hypothetical protein ACVW07_001567 [Cellulomonas sp. URHB0016]
MRDLADLALLHGDDGRDGPVDVDAGLGPVALDDREQRPDGVDHPQQHVGGRVVHGPLAVAQLDEQVLPHMGEPLEVAEREEAARALDGVDRPENAAQQVPGARSLLQRHEVAVQLVEVLMALDQELTDDLVDVLHACLPAEGRAAHLRYPTSSVG